jgi:purine-nucleoside phosphorylase
LFYDENENWKLWQKYGILGMEMEAAELFTLAAKFKRKALAILTVSDQLVKNEHSTAEERQLSYNQMIEIALETVIS